MYQHCEEPLSNYFASVRSHTFKSKNNTFVHIALAAVASALAVVYCVLLLVVVVVLLRPPLLMHVFTEREKR